MTIEFDKYLPLLAGYDLTEAQKVEIVTAVYKTVGAIVASEFACFNANKVVDEADLTDAANDDGVLDYALNSLNKIYNRAAK